MEEIEKIELYEKDGNGELKIDGKKLKSLTSYQIKRSTDMIDITFNISVPTKNFTTNSNP